MLTCLSIILKDIYLGIWAVTSYLTEFMNNWFLTGNCWWLTRKEKLAAINENEIIIHIDRLSIAWPSAIRYKVYKKGIKERVEEDNFGTSCKKEAKKMKEKKVKKWSNGGEE